MIRIALTLAALHLASPALAQTYRVKVVKVIDGDTLLTNRTLFGKRQKLRLRGIDTPEITAAQCP